MKDLIRETAAAGAAVVVSSHLLSLFEDLVTSLLILHKGKLVLHGRLADLVGQLDAEGQQESLEDLFFRLTEGQASADRGQESGIRDQGSGVSEQVPDP
jgi:ABC-2 type transport system ATP-binding protein